MTRIVTSGVLLAVLSFSAPAIAAEPAAATLETLAAVEAAALPPLAGDTDWSLPPVHLGGAKRGAVLPALYVSYAALNAFDAYSTSKGVATGAVEGNVMMRSAARSPAAMWAIKGGVTAVSIAVADRLWRQDRRVAAITTMVVSNVLAGFVAANNAAVLRHTR